MLLDIIELNHKKGKVYRMKRKFVLLMVVVLLMSSVVVTSNAEGSLISITGAVLNDQLNFTLNGTTVVPVGDDGTPVLPISYNGTTYLPVRAIGYLLGLGIEYEGPTKTVLISSTTTKTAPIAVPYVKSNQLIPISNAVLNEQLKFKLDNSSVIPVGDDGTPVLPISYNGTTYLPVRAIGYLLGLGIGYEGGSKTVLITKGASTQTPSTGQGAGWYFVDYVFTDGSGKYPQGSTSYDVTSFTGEKGNMQMSHIRYDVKTGKVLAGSTHQTIWSDPATYLKVGEKYTLSYETKQITSTASWNMGSITQQSISMDLAPYTAYFTMADGTKYIVKDMNAVLTMDREVTKGTKGQKKMITMNVGRNYKYIYNYEWRD